MKRRQTGFTLLEGIIAIAVISVGLMVGLTLAISNLLAAQENERRIKAANLAREGIEVVRNVRDNNFIHIDNNDTYNLGTTYYTFDTFLDQSENSVGNHFLIDYNSGSYRLVDAPTATTIEECISNDECIIDFDSTSGIYGGGTGEDTIYHRLITRQLICFDDATNLETDMTVADTTCATGSVVGNIITSHVRYETNREHDVIIKERLYDWR
jgi:prepilin-type N-terminal cleavage/methylation domain-containing protein